MRRKKDVEGNKWIIAQITEALKFQVKAINESVNATVELFKLAEDSGMDEIEERRVKDLLTAITTSTDRIRDFFLKRPQSITRDDE